MGGDRASKLRFRSTSGYGALCQVPSGACGGLLGESCRALGVAFLDLTPALRKAEAEGGPLYWSYDDHMRPVGYRKVEKLVYAWWSTP